ncbi:hypothetical protein HDU85_003750 [Gaertneriomyces sp. JEL0708]|nr:hypothetical protein HDU85_003750 [Gaertneriomyces sp. JEL0708]
MTTVMATGARPRLSSEAHHTIRRNGSYRPLPEEESVRLEPEDDSTPIGTIFSSCVNLSNTILGSGMLAMPAALASVGLGLGMLLIGFSGAASAFGLVLLTRLAAKVGRTSSFNACAKITYPDAAVWFDAAIAVKCFGVGVSYLVICGDLLPKVALGFASELSPTSIFLSPKFWISASLLLMAPFCFLPKLDSLRYTSAFALLSVVYLVFIVLYFFAFGRDVEGMPPRPGLSDLRWFNMDANFFGVLPIFVFAFTCHQNIFAVHNELIANTPARLKAVIFTSIGSAFSIYQVVAILGYLTFGSLVSSNIIAQYPPSPLITGGQLAIALLVGLSFPLQCHPCRASLDKIITHFELKREEGRRSSIERRTDGSILDREESTESIENESVSTGTLLEKYEISRTRWFGMTIGIMFTSWMLAILVDNLATVLAYVGATGSTTICHILPGLFYYKLSQQEEQSEEQTREGTRKKFDVTKICAVGLVFFGVFVMVTSLATLTFGTGGSA